MKKIPTAAMFACMSIACGAALAADVIKDDGMMKKDMTLQQCKDHMMMSKKDGMKKDDSMMKMDTMCKDMLAKEQLNMKKPGDHEMMKK